MSLKTLSLIWEAHFKNNLDDYQQIDSPEFTTNVKWQLHFFPAGSKAHGVYHSLKYPGDWVSFYFHNLSVSDAEASFRLSLLNQRKEKVFERTYDKTLVPGSHSGYGFPRYIEKSFILDPKNNIVKDYKITFLCEWIEEEVILKNKTAEKSFCRMKEFDDYENLLANKDFSDVTIIINEKVFDAHKCILASRSPVFDAMFKNDMMEKKESAVNIEDVEFEVFDEFLRFVYSAKVNNIEKMACELLYVAEKYSVEGLKAMCEDTMCTGVNQENAINYLCAANINNATKTRTEIMKYISLNIKTFLKNPDFKSLMKTHPELFYEIIEKSHKE